MATFRLDEMLVGLGALVLSATFTLFVVRTLPLRFRPSVGNLVQVWRLPWSIAVDALQIAFALLRDFLGHPAESHFRSVAYRYTSGSGADTARRTLAVATSTISPNFIVIGIDTDRRQMLFHQLKKTAVPALTQRLGAENGR
ncbi:MAG: hypothetical protein WA294_17540 [Acidobacteriaceae bacterium]